MDLELIVPQRLYFFLFILMIYPQNNR